MHHLFGDDDDTCALSDELERLINEHLPSPAAVLRAATYEMARALRDAPERDAVVLVEEMKRRRNDTAGVSEAEIHKGRKPFAAQLASELDERMAMEPTT